MQIAIKHKNDMSAQEIGEKRISLFNDMLIYWKKMKELSIAENNSETIQNSAPKVNLKPRTFLDDRRDFNELSNSPEIIAAMEEASKNMFRKLTDEDVENVKADCIALNAVFAKGLDIFESYFSTNLISLEDIKFLKESPFSGILSDNYFETVVLSNFDDTFVLGTILEMCFGQTIERTQALNLVFCTTPNINNEPKIKELLKVILTNSNSILIKDNLLSFAREIRELINLVYTYTKNENIIKGVNLKIFNTNNFLDDEFDSESNVVVLKNESSITSSNLKENIAPLTVSIQPTKSTNLNIKLIEYGFFELPKVKILSPTNQSVLVEKLATKGIPYAIAMFDYIEFFKLLDSKYFTTIKQRNIQIAKWFKTDERAIRGNKNVLDLGTTENKKRYTAHLHKENVKKEYEQLK